MLQALFWAAHHNQPDILEMLISNGARLAEVDKSGRTALDIAMSHDHKDIVEILSKHLKRDNTDDIDKNITGTDQIQAWFDFYPGVKKGKKYVFLIVINVG